MDERIRSKLWEGAVPIVFEMSSVEITTLNPPSPFFQMVPRLGYLPLSTVDAIEHFRSVAPVCGVQDIWYEHEGIPLKWHLPLGVLFDLHGDAARLPFAVTIHFQGFPAQQLLQCEGEQSVESFFMNSLKQALYLQTGTSQVAMNLAMSDQSQLWEGVRRNNMMLYSQVHTRLPKGGVRHVPIRCFMRGQRMQQLPITPERDESEEGGDGERTLGEVMHFLLPEHFGPNAGGEGSRSNFRVIVQGVSPPLAMPAVALWRDCQHPDGFLYICVAER